jgi:hypothetical protein
MADCIVYALTITLGRNQLQLLVGRLASIAQPSRLAIFSRAILPASRTTDSLSVLMRPSAPELLGSSVMKRTFTVVLVVVLGVAVSVVGRHHAANQRTAAAQAQVTRWADELHAQTTDSGIYIRHPADQLPENDPWGRPLSVTYAQGGFAETLTVRSAGPDGVPFTQDDILAHRSVVNLKGIGKGARDHVEEFAQNGARGLTKGVAEGIKESVQEVLADKKTGRKKQ